MTFLYIADTRNSFRCYGKTSLAILPSSSALAQLCSCFIGYIRNSPYELLWGGNYLFLLLRRFVWDASLDSKKHFLFSLMLLQVHNLSVKFPAIFLLCWQITHSKHDTYNAPFCEHAPLFILWAFYCCCTVTSYFSMQDLP